MEKLQPPKAPQVPSAAPLVTVADLFNAVSKQGEIDKLTNHIKELESQVQDLTGELRDVQDELETSRHREEIYRLENEVREALSDIK
jgi:predicted  nucleic acid-binding Zn-ribbon protein